MTVPFEPDQAVQLAAWLNLPDRATPVANSKETPPGRGASTPELQGVPEVQAVRVECASEDEWLAARLGGIGASEIGVIMGVSGWASPYALWYRKRLDWRLPRTEAQRWGHLVEDPIAELFAEQHDELFIANPVGAPYSLWCHPVRRWMLCTPDRLAVDADGRVMPVELKSDEGGPGWGEPGTDEVPEHHKLQSMWQSHILGSHGGWVVRKRGSGRGRVVPYWVDYDPNIGADMIDAAEAFLESIARNEPPEPDGSKSTTETLKEISPALDENEFAEIPGGLYADWVFARHEKREALAREALASNRLRAAMGRAEFATYRTVDGFQVIFAKRRIGKRAGYEVPPGQTDQLKEIRGERQATDGVPGGPGSDPTLADDVDLGDDGWFPADPEAATAAGQEGPGGGAGAAGGVADGEDQPRIADAIDEADEEFLRYQGEFMYENDELLRRLED